MGPQPSQNDSRIGTESLLKGYRHLVQNADYLGGNVGFIERRLSVAQLLEEMSFGIPTTELAKMYSLPPEAIEEALRFASQAVTRQLDVS